MRGLPKLEGKTGEAGDCSYDLEVMDIIASRENLVFLRCEKGLS